MLGITVSTTFGSCDAGHPPMFNVRKGLEAEDVLVVSPASTGTAL